MNSLYDSLSRPFNYLRISVTDRCNYRCSYCMPKDIFDNNYNFLKRDNLMTFEENVFVINALTELGLNKVRLTGGEPLLRRNIEVLISKIRDLEKIKDISITTNGSLLDKDRIALLHSNGLNSITISLDSLKSATNNLLNPLHKNDKVIEAIMNSAQTFKKVKVNFVVMKNINDNEIEDVIDRFKDHNIELRFIEFMDVGQTNNWKIENVVKSRDIIKRIKKLYTLDKIISPRHSTSELYKINNHKLILGSISSITKPFCMTCNRGRLSADGKFFTCLFSTSGFDILSKIRSGIDKNEFIDFFQEIWSKRNDKYSIDRKNIVSNKSKIEMSYIGG